MSSNIVLEPYQKITVRSHMRYENPEAYVDTIIPPAQRGAGGSFGGLFWANGILFRHFPYAPTDSVTKEYLAGHLPIDHLDFAPMPQFRNEIRSGNAVMTVINVSNHSILSALASWVARTLVNNPNP